jgi:hypothetical protein
MKEIQIRNRKVKLSLFADDMTLYLKDPNDFIRNLLDLILKTLGNSEDSKQFS